MQAATRFLIMSVLDQAGINYPLVIWSYVPNKIAALIVGIVLLILAVILFIRLFRRRNYWGLCLPIGVICYSLGFFFRFAMAHKPTSKPIFILEEIFVVVSPAAFLAFNYVVYGRIIHGSVGERKGYSFIKPSLVSTIFVLSDVVTFLLQVIGAAMEANDNTLETGRHILLTGLVLQTASYLFFTLLITYSHWRIAKDKMLDYSDFPWILVYVIYVSSVAILLRGAFRIAIFGGGKDGFLNTTEYIFYILDALPLFIATSVYAIWWPGDYFDRLQLLEFSGVPANGSV